MKKIGTMPLTVQEKRIIIDKETEIPFVGEYCTTKEPWIYYCRQCGSALYYAENKFDSGCGWPSFDDAIPWAVKRTDDEDGIRTEITCMNCWWHLWHVFTGEHMTDKNTRHCVNSLSMIFVKDAHKEQAQYEQTTLWGWCFWCIEAWLQWLKWVVQIYSWYSGGKRQYPTYKHICTWCTWHIEVVQVTFDPAILSYETLLKVFFTLHDPTSVDKQWADTGEQYRSVILYHNTIQKEIAEKVIADLNMQHIYDTPIVTQVSELDHFWIAEWYHQNYYDQHENTPYCQLVINPKIARLKKEWSNLLKE